MASVSLEAANRATTLRDIVPFGVDLHFSLIATKQPVAIRWHRSPYRRFVATVQYGGVDMERRPLFWRLARFELMAKEFVDHGKAIQSSLLVGAKLESVSVTWRGRGTQMVARRRVLRSSAVHRLR